MQQGSEHMYKVGFKDGDNYIVHQSWRNRLGTILLAAALVGATSYLTILYPDYTTVPLEFFGVEFDLPILNIVPMALLARAAYVIYNERFVLTPDYLIHVTGRWAWRGRSSRLEYSRIQEIEIEETILQRVLRVGDIKLIPLAGSEVSSVKLQGIASPRGLKDLIRERMNRPRPM